MSLLDWLGGQNAYRQVIQAITTQYLDKIRRILHKKPFLINKIYERPYSLLTYAATIGNAAACAYLIDRGADINKKDNASLYPLTVACMCGNYDTVLLLTDKGADLNPSDNAGDSPIIVASWCEGGRRLLTEASNEFRNDIFIEKENHYGIIDRLIKSGVNVNQKDSSGKTPLYWVCYVSFSSSKLDIIKLLIAAGADVNVRTNEGDSPILAATASGDVNIVKTLV